jgi:hypothetical protein
VLENIAQVNSKTNNGYTKFTMILLSLVSNS